MRRIKLFCIILLFALGSSPWAEENAAPGNLVSLHALGPLIGLYEAGYETLLSGSVGLSVHAGFYDMDWGLLGLLPSTWLRMWTVFLGAGVAWYPLGEAPSGWFVLATLEAAYASMSSSAYRTGGLMLTPFLGGGYRFRWGAWSAAPMLGLGYSVAFFDAASVYGFSPFTAMLSVAVGYSF